MLDRIYNLEEKRRLVDALLARANAHLTGKVGPIETARAFSGFGGVDQALDKLLMTFVAVNSETDGLPTGEVRQHWNAESLKREDIQIAKAESWCCEMVADACRELVTAITPLLAELHDQRPYDGQSAGGDTKL
jgi:hypothetical protein